MHFPSGRAEARVWWHFEGKLGYLCLGGGGGEQLGVEGCRAWPYEAWGSCLPVQRQRVPSQLMRNLLGTHLGHSAIYHMCRIMEDR